MSLLKRALTIFSFCIIAVSALRAQTTLSGGGSSIVTQQVITTAVPFLRINPDARAGGMGDIGIATPVDANGLYANPAKMGFIDNDYGFAMSFSPWLKALVNDIYLASLNGYYKVKKEQVISFSLRYFSLGNIQFTDANGTNTQQFMPREFAIDVNYSRKLGKYFSIAASLRYIYSNLASGQSVDGNLVKAGMAGAGDISWYFHKTFNEGGAIEHEFSCGMDISNIGSKMSYTSEIVKDFIPTNMGIGLGYTVQLDKHNSVGIYSDINKLLVPTPNGRIDSTVNPPQYYYREESSIKGMFTSFGDAPAIVQLREYTWSIGAEYYYNKQFGVRTGYFYEPIAAGGRQFLEAGLTVKYSIVALHFSYLIPTTILRNPLDNTLRFSLLFDFAKGGVKKGGENYSGVSFIDDTPKKKTEPTPPPAVPTKTSIPATTTPAQTTPEQQPQTTPDNTVPASPK